MSNRHSLNNVIHFAKREFKEKRPKLVKVLKVKNRSILRRGFLPNFQIFEKPSQIYFLVMAEYSEYFRLYYFDQLGSLIRGNNFEKNEKNLKDLNNATTKAYQIPKKEIKLNYQDESALLKEKSKKILKTVNQFLNTNLTFPFVIIAGQNQNIKRDRNFGAYKEKSQLFLPINARKKGIFQIIILNEIFYQYLSTHLRLTFPQDELLDDIAILLTNLFLKNKYHNLLSKTLEPERIIRLLKLFNITELVKKSLLSIERNYTNKEVSNFFFNLKNILSVFKRYKIKLDKIELIYFCKKLTNSYMNIKSQFFSKKFNVLKSNTIFFSLFFKCYLFKKNLEDKSYIDDQVIQKDIFLCWMFGLIDFKNANFQKFLEIQDFKFKMENLYELIQIFKSYSTLNILGVEIENFQELLTTSLTRFIFRYLISTKFNIMTNESYIQGILEIQNKSNYVFKNFEYNLYWRPKNRIEIQNSKKIDKARDLNLRLKENFTFSILNKGKVRFFCFVKFKHLLENDEVIQKKLKLQSIEL